MRKGVQGVRVYRKSKTAQKNHSLRKEPTPRGATTNLERSPEISNFSTFNAKKEVSFLAIQLSCKDCAVTSEQGISKLSVLLYYIILYLLLLLLLLLLLFLFWAYPI